MANPRDKERENPDFNPAPRVSLRPAATGGSVYVPPVQQNNNVAVLVAGLSKLEPAISELIQKEQKAVNEQDYVKGRKMALESALDEHEAIRAGKIAPQESKWFMKGYREQYGSILGDKLSTDILGQWTNSPDKDSDHAGEFVNKFMADKIAEVTKNIQDKDVLAGLLPKLEQARAGIVAAQKKYTADRIIETKADLVGTEIMGLARSVAQGGNPQDVLNKLREIDKANVSRPGKEGFGVLPADVFNESAVKAFIAVAKETPDYGRAMKVLDTLQKHPFIGNNPKYAGAIASARKEALSFHQSQVSFGWTAEERNRKRTADQLQTMFLTEAQQRKGVLDDMRFDMNGTVMDGNQMLKLIARVDPDSVSSTIAAANSWSNQRTALDPNKRMDLRLKIMQSADPIAAVREAARTNSLGQQDIDTFLSDARTRTDDKTLWDHTAMQNALKEISEASNVQRVGVNKPVLTLAEQAELSQRFFSEITAWREANPEASQAVIGNEVQKLKTRLITEAEKAARERKPAPAKPAQAPAAKPAQAPKAQPTPQQGPSLTDEQFQKLLEKWQ